MSAAKREGATAPDHHDPQARAGLTARRRRLGLPVGREGLAGPHYFDATGERELTVGDFVYDGSDTGKVIDLNDDGNEEGGPPQVVVEWGPDGEYPAHAETYDTRPRNYRAEGPDWPENWVCDDFTVVTETKGILHG